MHFTWLACVAVLSIAAPALAGTIQPHSAWPNQDVSVCFSPGEAFNVSSVDGPFTGMSAEWTATEKTRFQAWAEEQYTAERTGIHFTGWGDCDETADANVVLYVTESRQGELGGRASLGTTGKVRNRPAARGYVWIKRSNFYKTTVIHELGHVAGLRHEHERREVLTDPECTWVLQHGPTDEQFAFFERIHEPFGSYDADSLMNYCNVAQRIGAPTILSEGDVATLRHLYPR